MRINKSRYAVLGLLTMEPMSGYDIKKKIETMAGFFWKENYSQIYPILKRLLSEKLVSRTIEKQIGKPDRHVYELAEKGNEALIEWLLEPVEHHVGRHEILLKLLFGKAVSVADNIEQVKYFQKTQQKELEDLKIIKTQMKAVNQIKPRVPYRNMLIRFGELINEALLKWSAESLAGMEKMKDG